MRTAIIRTGAVNGDELDCFTHRHDLTCFRRPGVARRTKTRYNRRVRRSVRVALAMGMEV